MRRTILIRPEAERDIEDNFKWYENQRGGLGQDFLLCIEEGLAKIQRNPEMYALVYKNVRQVLVRRFPYRILYFFDEGLIVVVAICHAHRDPHSWQSRT